MFEFLRSLFNPAPPSGTTAKERLRLVLLSDHLSLAPDVVDALKRDLLEVISRYVEIDSEHADVTFEHRERDVAMLASIPITGVRERKRVEMPAPVAQSAVADMPSPELPLAETPVADVPVEATQGAESPAADMVSGDAPPVPIAVPADETVVANAMPQRSGSVSASRRRRRKKAAGAVVAQRAPGQQVGKPAQA